MKKPWARWAILAASVAVIVVLFVLLRPSDGGRVASHTPPVSAPSGSPSPTASGSPSPSASPSPARTIVDATYRDGATRGPTRFTVRQGERVRIVVRADVSDEVHLHGYDRSADVTPDEPARIDFVANAVGLYEVELEGAGELLIRLEIVP